MTTTEGWANVSEQTQAITAVGTMMISDNSTLWGLFMILWIVVGNMFIINLFVGVIIDNFNLIKEELGGIRLLTAEQRNWVEIQKLFLKNTPEMLIKPPEG